MSIYKRILLATDFSDINRVAAERAARLAKQENCELILFHVVEHFPMDSGPLISVFQYTTEVDEALTRDVMNKMDDLKQSLDCPEILTRLKVSTKSARHEILRFAEENKVDLIVVAPHGRGIIGALGSTATGVINNSKCDVLAVRESSEYPV
jgi:universal stress protein A